MEETSNLNNLMDKLKNEREERSKIPPVNVDELIEKIKKNHDERIKAVDAIRQKVNEAKQKYDAINIINKEITFSNTIEEMIKEHDEAMDEIEEIFNQDTISRQKEADIFTADKTEEELRFYLATRPIPYNDWKDADYETLSELTYQMYDIPYDSSL